MPLDKRRQKIRAAASLAAHISYWSLVSGIILTAAVYRGYQKKISG